MSVNSPLMPLHAAYAASCARTSDVALTVSASRPGAAVGRRTAATPEIEMLPWGVAMPEVAPSISVAGSSAESTPLCEIIASFGEVEAEYAAIRRGAGLLDSPHRGTLLVSGKDRVEFLNRMLTQELKGLGAGATRESFWLNRKGRIDADVFVIELGDRMLIDLDVANVAAAAKSLGEFVFTEDIEIRDVSEQFHHVAVHGRLARETVAAARNEPEFELAIGAAKTITIDNAPVVVARRDQTGEAGFALIMPREAAPGVWEFLRAADHIVGEDKRKVRPIGWHAFNVARIEAGEALFNIDFGPTNLPHQVGEMLARRVSFSKGCYLGQEIVARMHSRGHSKPTLVGLRMKADRLPVAGAQVFAKTANEGEQAGELGEPIGVVTSSTISPMLGAQPIALAMLRAAGTPAGSIVLVNAEGEQAEATLASMRAWPGPATQETA